MIKYSVCPHDCPDTCGWQVDVQDGKVTQVSGDPDNPVTRGIICAKAQHYPARIYGSDRVLYPLKRSGPKGSGQFSRITWEEALGEITDNWQQLRARFGAQCILPYSYAGTEGVVNNASMDRRFFNRLGASKLERTICSAAGKAGYNLVYGAAKAMNPRVTPAAKLIIFWGINALETNLHQALLAQDARKQGAKLVAIDVHRNRTADWADEFYQVLPGSDGALALGLCHILVREGWSDNAWSEQFTSGAAELTTVAAEYPPERVAVLTGLTQAQIFRLAQLYAQTKPSLIRLGNGLQHHDNGGMVTRAIACLPALTGAWRDLGGGMLKQNSAYFPLNKVALERPELSQGDLRTINMNQLGRALNDLEPPIRSLYVYNSNPLAIAPEQNLVHQGLAREDLFTVVHEQVMTDTAQWADIVLPATTALEHADLYTSYWHCLLQWADPVIAPLGEAKSNIAVFSQLARRMGFTDQCFDDSTETVAAQALDLPYWRERGITLDRLKKERFIELDIPPIPYAQGGFATVSGLAEVSSQHAAQLGLGALPRHVPLVEGPESKNEAYPLTLISPPNHQFLNSTFANIPPLRLQAGVPTIEINSIDAVARQIAQGDWVEVFNARGTCSLQAVVGNSVLPGVVVATGVWPEQDYPSGYGINSLTPGRLADMGNGATFFSNLVNVRRLATTI
ncbi:MAG: molybdopterin oxidoreductase family protein [Peptococcaceae bacterium]|nr:molybdopterin oxidoreductase family protein [Peptococcaceae bacterium]